MPYAIEPLSADNAHQWEEFNRRSKEGTVFHSIRWKRVLEEALGLKLQYYLIFDGQKVIGICPFTEESSSVFRGLVGIPYTEVNNIILDGSFAPGQINEILALFPKEYAYLQFTTYNPEVPDCITYTCFHTEEMGNMNVDLERTPPDAIWNTFSRSTRKSILRFEKEGFTIQETDRPPDIERFYQYYAINTRHINGETLPFPFFQRLMDSFLPDDLRVAILTKGDIFAGGSLAIMDHDQKTVYYEYLALNRDLPHYTPTLYVDWELVRWAWEHGYERISFGRQRSDSNNYRYRNKKKFGAGYKPIHSRTVILSRTASLMYGLKRALNGRRGRTL